MVFTGETFTASDGAKFKLIKSPFCRFCHSPLDPKEHYWRCLTCHNVEAKLHIQYSFDQARAAGVYSKVRKNASSTYVLRNKRDRSVAPILAEPMAYVIRQYAPHYTLVDLVAAVPKTPEKLAAKGFNQAEEIAKALGRLVGLPLASDLLAQVKEPPESQHRVPEFLDRFENIKGCFESGIVPEWAESVLLVDDTYTTGATVNECARVLKAGGVKRVFVMCAARGVMVSEKTGYLEEYFDD